MSRFPVIEYMEEEDPLRLPEDATPLDGLRAVYTNGKIPLHTRLKAMVEAAPFVHPKLAVSAQIEGKDLAALLDQRLKRINGGKVIRQTNGAKVIEAKALEDDL